MSLDELQQELRRLREPGTVPPTGAPHLSVENALAYRNAGNLPDDSGRTLRLVLHIGDPPEPGAIERRRLDFEPDYHDEPTWRRAGSSPVNVVPLRAEGGRREPPDAWYEEPRVAALEAEWQATGTVAGFRIPADLRGFVFKTVLALRAAGREPSVEAVSASIARWLPRPEAALVRKRLQQANDESGGATRG